MYGGGGVKPAVGGVRGMNGCRKENALIIYA
jgi:hypothetical protein